MGVKNSSETRVRPVFNALLDRDPTGRSWLPHLCQMAASTRESNPNYECGSLVTSETPVSRSARLGVVFERLIPPSGAFLRWLIENPDQMQIADPVSYGATGLSAEWRRLLFSSNLAERKKAQKEAQSQLLQVGANNSRHLWWAFEGFTHVDCCLMTDSCVILVEGKRTESVSASTRWFSSRSQLWRNVECAAVLASGKRFAVILAVENDGDGVEALAIAEQSMNESLPHLTEEDREPLLRALLGYVTWVSIAERFGLDSSCLPETIHDLQTSGSPSTLAGVDGCRGGWVVASSDSSVRELRFEVVRNLSSMLDNNEFRHIAIDIPIGLPFDKPRSCDEQARKRLGKGQGSRVFPAPMRAAIQASTKEAARAINIRACGKSLSEQVLGILPKIKEVDDWVHPKMQNRIHEVHPEVSFCVLNGSPLKFGKATREGQQERMAILKANGVSFDSDLERAKLGRSVVAVDDVIDAAVCLLTAKRIQDGDAVVIGGGLDERGLKMEIRA